MAGPGSANGYGSDAAALYFVFESIVKTSHYLVDFYERYLFAHQATEAFQRKGRFRESSAAGSRCKNSHIRDTFATNISVTTILEKVDFGPHGPEAQGGRRRLDVFALNCRREGVDMFDVRQAARGARVLAAGALRGCALTDPTADQQDKQKAIRATRGADRSRRRASAAERDGRGIA
jgi:hypothetical protein